MAGQSSVSYSFIDPIEAYLSNNEVLFYILETIRKQKKKIQIYNSVSSECFGNQKNPVCSEKSKFNPVSPYGISKVAAFHITKYFRQAHGLFASNGILFNHESPRRGLNFVTRKITHSLARILKGEEKKIHLGDISTKRDWGHSKDYAIGIWKILQYKKPEDFVLSTGKNVSVEEFIKKLFKILNLDWKKFVTTNNKKFLRPSEVRSLKGDSRKARKLLKWKPKYNLEDICKDMLEADLKLYGMTLNQAKEIAKKIKF